MSNLANAGQVCQHLTVTVLPRPTNKGKSRFPKTGSTQLSKAGSPHPEVTLVVNNPSIHSSTPAGQKNYDPNDLTTLRDISLLPTIHKIFAKCLVNRILPQLIGSAVQFWQRAYTKDRDRQELIFLKKTAIDDFRHTSSRFYAIFVDFRDAFGSLDKEYLIRSLMDSGIEKYTVYL